MQFDDISKALFELLDVPSVTASLTDSAGIHFEFAPPEANLPYIVFERITGEAFDSHSRRGELPLYQVSVFARSSYTAETIMSAADDVLHQQSISPSGMEGHNVWRVAGPRTLPIPEEEVFHSNADYEIRVQET